MGAAVQAGLIAGVEVGAILVDITPHTLGIEGGSARLGTGCVLVHTFAPIIEARNTFPCTASLEDRNLLYCLRGPERGGRPRGVS